MERWFEDDETRRWLGGPNWPRRALCLAADPGVGGDHVRGRFALVASQDENAVGLIDVETYMDGTASIALVVDPCRRGRGFGKAILSALLAAPDLKDVSVARAGTELANEAGVRCLRAAHFVPEAAAPDVDGVVYFRRALGSAG